MSRKSEFLDGGGGARGILREEETKRTSSFPDIVEAECNVTIVEILKIQNKN